MTPEQQQIVFEAFQQADGSTSRQYGGTGLSLSISRELATRLGGQIDLASEMGKGSTFTLYLPLGRSATQQPALQLEPALSSSNGQASGKTSPVRIPAPSSTSIKPMSPPASQPGLLDDRDNLQTSDRLLLIVEDDARFAKVTYNYAHKKNFKCLIAGDGQTGLHLAQTHKVDANILDLNLPGIDGWAVYLTEAVNYAELRKLYKSDYPTFIGLTQLTHFTPLNPPCQGGSLAPPPSRGRLGGGRKPELTPTA